MDHAFLLAQYLYNRQLGTSDDKCSDDYFGMLSEAWPAASRSAFFLKKSLRIGL
jgi:hypothetical protein